MMDNSYSKLKEYEDAQRESSQAKPEKVHGGPQGYYDFPPSWVTLNDCMEWLAENRWKGDSIYLFNIFKACYRWGAKDGTTTVYDAKKMVYYSLRLFIKLTSVSDGRKYLQELLNDKQFQEK